MTATSQDCEPGDKVSTRPRPVSGHVAELIVELQSVGLRVEAKLETAAAVSATER